MTYNQLMGGSMGRGEIQMSQWYIKGRRTFWKVEEKEVVYMQD